MNIAICDDDERYLNELKAYVEEYMTSHYIKAEMLTQALPRRLQSAKNHI